MGILDLIFYCFAVVIIVIAVHEIRIANAELSRLRNAAKEDNCGLLQRQQRNH